VRTSAKDYALSKGRVVFSIKMLLIVVAALILVGPEKLPEIAQTIGKAMRMFNTAKEDMTRMVQLDMFNVDGTPRDVPTTITEAAPSVATTLYAADDDDEEEEE
jgi:Sec-independent protein translocase protein TatA